MRNYSLSVEAMTISIFAATSPLSILTTRTHRNRWKHYNDVTMGAMASQITSLTIVYSTVHSGADQRKHQSSALLAFVRGTHRWPVISPHKGPVTRKMFPFDDVIMKNRPWLCTCPESWQYFIPWDDVAVEIRDIILVITVHADVLAPDAVRPSAGTIIIRKLVRYNVKCLGLTKR